MNTGGPAFPCQPMDRQGMPSNVMMEGMTPLDWFAGQETLADFDHPGEQMPVNGAVTLAGPPPVDASWEATMKWNAVWRAKLKWMRAEAMLAEKLKREQDNE